MRSRFARSECSAAARICSSTRRVARSETTSLAAVSSSTRISETISISSSRSILSIRSIEYEWNVTMPSLFASESLFHGVRCGMFFLDKNADVESTDEMSERKFNFLYNHLPDRCGINDCENLYSKMFEEDNPDIVEQLPSFPGFEDCIIDIERF